MFNKINLILQKWPDISPVCDFIFGSIRTSLLTDTVDVDLTIGLSKVSIHTGKTYSGVNNLYSME